MDFLESDDIIENRLSLILGIVSRTGYFSIARCIESDLVPTVSRYVLATVSQYTVEVEPSQVSGVVLQFKGIVRKAL